MPLDLRGVESTIDDDALQRLHETSPEITSPVSQEVDRITGNQSCILRDTVGNPTISLAIPASTFSLCAFGNLLAILYLWKTRRDSDQQHIRFYTLLTALTWCDLIGVIVTSPVTFATYMSGSCVTEIGGQSLCNYSGFVMIFFVLTSMTIVFAMSCERFVAIRFPLFYTSWITTRKVLGILSVLVMACFTVSTLPLLGFGKVSQQMPGSWCYLDWTSHVTRHQAFNFIAVFLGLTVMFGTVICNLLAIAHVRNSRKRLFTDKKRRKMPKQEKEIMILMGIVTAVFVLCNLPLMVRIIINQVSAIQSESFATSSLSSWNLFAVRMASINPIVDPWVYILYRQSIFRKLFHHLKRAITCCCGKDGMEDLVKNGDRQSPDSRFQTKVQVVECKRADAV